MAYRFTRVWAAIQVAVGFLFIIGGIVAGVAVLLWLPRDPLARLNFTPVEEFAFRLLGAAIVALVGLAIGASLVVTGHLVQVQLSTLRRLRRIAGYLRRWELERLDREAQERRARRLK